MTNQEDMIEAIVPLVTHHLRPQQYYEAQASDGAVRRLARNVKRIDRLVRVADADMGGRPGLPVEEFAAGKWLLARAQALAVEDAAPGPIVMGRHLIALGLTPGKAFGPLLDACFEAQLDGAFATLEDGIAYARALIAGAREQP
jgi:tRNA nucleotidyltransferase (CCA-adding enzyme)